MNMKPIYYTVLSAFFITVALFWTGCNTLPIAPDLEDDRFIKYYFGSEADQGISVAPAVDGGYWIMGTSYSFSDGGADIVCIRTDNRGNEITTTHFGGPFDDEGRGINATMDHGFILSGTTTDTAGIQNTILVRTTSQGEEIWKRTYGNAEQNLVCGMARELASGGFVIVGSKDTVMGDPFNPVVDIYLMVTDADGNVVRTQRYESSSDDFGVDVYELPTGGFGILATTTTFGLGVPASNLMFIRTNAEGAEVDRDFYGTNLEEIASTMTPTMDGGFIISGTAFRGTELTNPQTYVIKIDGEGQEMWSYIGESEATAISAMQKPSGNIFVSGTKTVPSEGNINTDHYLLTLSSDGEFMDEISLGGTGEDYSSQLCVDCPGESIIFTGTTEIDFIKHITLIKRKMEYQ